MNRLFFVVLLILSSINATAQNAVKAYVTANQHQVSSIDPSDTSYSDLQPVADAIGDAQVVMIGEQDHGDAATLLAKTRIVKYLVEKRGFTVMAFESDFYSLVKGWDKVTPHKDSIKQFLLDNIFYNWSHCVQCDPLFTYLAEKIVTKKLDFTGFDSQHHGAYTQKNYYNRDLPAFLDSSEIKLQQLPAIRRLTDAYNSFGNAKNRLQKDNSMKAIIAVYDSVQQKASEKYGEADFWVQELKSKKASMEQGLAFMNGVGFSGEAIRDRQMADNLYWLIRNLYPGRKIIVWAANDHVGKKAVNNDINNEFMIKPMGEVFVQHTAPAIKTFSIGFTSLKGKSGKLEEKRYTIPKIKDNSFESWVSESKFDYGFVEFRNLSNRGELFLMMGEMYHRYANADWTNIYDAVFYIKDMYRCDEIKQTKPSRQ